jgi:hypothetical protein
MGIASFVCFAIGACCLVLAMLIELRARIGAVASAPAEPLERELAQRRRTGRTLLVRRGVRTGAFIAAMIVALAGFWEVAILAHRVTPY